MRKITVTYTEDVNAILDGKIIKQMKAIGYQWYAQGYNFKTKKRDLAFEEGKEK